MASAASVAWAFTASTMVEKTPLSSSGVALGTTWANCSTGPLIFRPLLRQACTCA